jgi:hypothetical protein
MNKLFFLLTLLYLPFSSPASSFPEPMVFDLMRGLDAKKGETEFNLLTSSNFTSHDQHLLLNPEFEYAIADGVALELEIPIDHKPLSSKLGLQYTLTPPSTKFMIGIQAIYEHFFEHDREDFSLSGIMNLRISEKISMVSLLGLRDATMLGHHDHYAFIMNLSLFYQYSDRLSLGLENDRNIYYGKQKLKALSIPQVSWKVNKNMKIQTGVGFNWHNKKDIEGFSRFIFEF